MDAVFLRDQVRRWTDEASSLASLRRIELSLLVLGLTAGAAAALSPAPFLPREPWSPRRVALTFDDGPHPAYTPLLLDALRREHARATFFLVGAPAQEHRPLVEEILRRGHEAGNHTYSHPNVTRISRAALLDELSRTQRVLEEAGFRGPRFFRPPGGRFNGRALATARAAGYRMVLWTSLPRDHENPSPEDVLHRVLAEVSDGGVVLLHSGIDSTLKALPDLLRQLRARGYRCVPVGELLAAPRSTDPTALWLDASSPPRRPSPSPDVPPESAGAAW